MQVLSGTPNKTKITWKQTSKKGEQKDRNSITAQKDTDLFDSQTTTIMKMLSANLSGFAVSLQVEKCTLRWAHWGVGLAGSYTDFSHSPDYHNNGDPQRI